jgi:hypothetical protein
MTSRTVKTSRFAVAILTAAVVVMVPMTHALAASTAHSLFMDCDGPNDTQGEVLIASTPNAATCHGYVLPVTTGTLTWTTTSAGTFSGPNPCTLIQTATFSYCDITYNSPSTLGDFRITATFSGGGSVGEEVKIVTSICPPTCGGTGGGGGGQTNNNTSTTLACGPAILGAADACTATVTDLGGGTFTKAPPTGTVSFSGGLGSFSAASCALGSPNTTTNSSSCGVNFTPSAQGAMTLTATYGGGSQWNGSVGTASLNVQPSTASPGSFQPDGLIRKFGGTFLGNNIYNGTGNHQTVRAHAARGQSRAFQIKVQNDGKAKDQIFVSVPGQRPPGFRLRYFVGTKDVTAKVANHTFQTPVLAPGATSTLRVVVTVLSKAPLNTVRAWYVDIRSSSNPTKRDVVKFKIFTPKA